MSMGHLPNTFCFISPSICFISPSNLLRFPKKMLYFPNSLLHFPNKMLHLPNSLLHFPMQCCVTLPKNILPNILSFFYIFGIKFCLKFSGDSGIKRGGGGVGVKPTIIFSHRRKTSSFYAVLFHMHLQSMRPFSGVAALLAGKRFHAGV